MIVSTVIRTLKLFLLVVAMTAIIENVESEVGQFRRRSAGSTFLRTKTTTITATIEDKSRALEEKGKSSGVSTSSIHVSNDPEPHHDEIDDTSTEKSKSETMTTIEEKTEVSEPAADADEDEAVDDKNAENNKNNESSSDNKYDDGTESVAIITLNGSNSDKQ